MNRPSFLPLHAASSLLWIACNPAAEPTGGDESDPADRPEFEAVEHTFPETLPPIEESLARLQALDLFHEAIPYETHTVHTWIAYGGYWSEENVALSETEIAARLDEFVDLAESAVLAVSESAVTNDVDALCFDNGYYCLANEPHANDMQALDNLEILDIDEMLRDDQENTGSCYVAWEGVSLQECERAYRVHAVVEATRDLPSRETPTEPPAETQE